MSHHASDDYLEKLREALVSTYFSNQPAGFPATPADEIDLKEHLLTRLQESDEVILPWVSGCVNLENAEVLEIGCGTGSSTASFARRAGFVHGYDIVHRCVDAANERLRIMGLSNARAHCIPPEEMIDHLKRTHADGVDVVLLYAVLEHQTIAERLATLEACWELLRPGGHMVVTDSPNRLCYKHFHTSEVPFFDMLPEVLAMSEIPKSPRDGFRNTMLAELENSPEHARLVLERWGTGISHHEFEVALGALNDLVVGDGFDLPIASYKPLVLEEELLLRYLVMSDLDVPLGFSRVSVDMILRKPNGDPPPVFHSQAEAHVERIRREMAAPSAAVSATLHGTQALISSLPATPEIPPGMPMRVEPAWALRVADESLNGRMLVRLVVHKLWQKLKGRSNRSETPQ